MITLIWLYVRETFIYCLLHKANKACCGMDNLKSKVASLRFSFLLLLRCKQNNHQSCAGVQKIRVLTASKKCKQTYTVFENHPKCLVPSHTSQIRHFYLIYKYCAIKLQNCYGNKCNLGKIPTDLNMYFPGGLVYSYIFQERYRPASLNTLRIV